MPMNEQMLANEILQAINQEMGGGGKDVVKYRQKLAKAVARAVVAHIRLNMNDTQGNKHF